MIFRTHACIKYQRKYCDAIKHSNVFTSNETVKGLKFVHSPLFLYIHASVLRNCYILTYINLVFIDSYFYALNILVPPKDKTINWNFVKSDETKL